MENLLRLLPPELKISISQLPPEVQKELAEIRLRVDRPIVLRLSAANLYWEESGAITAQPSRPQIWSRETMNKTLQLISKSSLYAFEEELKNGYITLQGGHRVGLCGRVVLEKGRIKGLKYISGLNLRLARQIKGAAGCLPELWQGQNCPNVLLFSPPGCGKTTVLRDLIRCLSNQGYTLGVVDERSEIAACYQGIPAMEVGVNTDVLDACPKAAGMLMLLRSMSPQIIATDEVGRPEDVAALQEAVNAGVGIIFTVHAASREDLYRRPVLADLLQMKVINYLVKLDQKPQKGTIAEIWPEI